MRQLKCECGACKTCTDRAKWRAKYSKKAKAQIQEQQIYPARHEVVLWECSDGREFSQELEAAYHQLDIYRLVARSKQL